MNRIQQVWVLFFFVDLVISFSFELTIQSMGLSFDNGVALEYETLIEKIIYIVLLAPLLETAIFQSLFFELIFPKRKSTTNTVLAIVISGIAFGLTHWYSWHYVVFGIYSGIYYGYVYAYFQKRKYLAFWAVALMHIGFNFITFLLNELLQ